VDDRSNPTSPLSPTLWCPFSPLARRAAARAKSADVLRLLASAAGALALVGWLDPGAAELFLAVALGACAYAILTACTAPRRAESREGTTKQIDCGVTTGEPSHVRIAPIYFAGG
jgi:hypothetical protein